MTLQKPRNFKFTLKGNAYQNFEYGLNSNAEATKKNYRYALERHTAGTGKHRQIAIAFKIRIPRITKIVIQPACIYIYARLRIFL